MLFYILLTLLYIPLCIILPTKVVGKKNLPKKGRVIVACNHQTLNDVPILAYKLTRRRLHFMAKDSLFKNKFFGWVLRRLGGFPVKRGENDITAVKTTMGLLKKEKAVCLFPEGSRLITSEKNQLKNGAAMFALKTNSPIVPVYIIKRTKAFTRNIMVVGKPFNLSEMEQFKGRKMDKDLLNEASKIVSEKMFECRDDYFEYLHKKNAKFKK